MGRTTSKIQMATHILPPKKNEREKEEEARIPSQGAGWTAWPRGTNWSHALRMPTGARHVRHGERWRARSPRRVLLGDGAGAPRRSIAHISAQRHNAFTQKAQ